MTADDVVRRVMIALVKTGLVQPGIAWPPWSGLSEVPGDSLADATNVVAAYAQEVIVDALATNNLLRWIVAAKRVVIDGRVFKDEGTDTCWMASAPEGFERHSAEFAGQEEEDRHSEADPEAS